MKINAGLEEDPTGQNWRLQLDGAQWGIALEALRRYEAQAEDGGTHPGQVRLAFVATLSRKQD